MNDSLFGVTSGANGKITAIRRAYNSANVILAIDGFKNFTGIELVRKGHLVQKYDGFCFSVFWKYNHHVLQFGNVAGQVVTAGQELVGRTSGAFGVVKKVVNTTANGYSRGAGGADD